MHKIVTRSRSVAESQRPQDPTESTEWWVMDLPTTRIWFELRKPDAESAQPDDQWELSHC